MKSSFDRELENQFVDDNDTRSETLKLVTSKDPLSKILDDLSKQSMKIYNSSLYVMRQEFRKTGDIIDYNQVYRDYFREGKHYNKLYNTLPAQTSQQTMKLAEKAMNSFSKLLEGYLDNNRLRLKGRPGLPKYKDSKTGRCPVIFKNQQIKYTAFSKEKQQETHLTGSISFPKEFGKTTKTKLGIPDLNVKLDLKERLTNSGELKSPIQEVRIIPLLNSYKIELVYTKFIKPKTFSSHSYAAIDLGLNNFAAIVTYKPQDNKSVILNGKGLKSYNNYFNDKLSTMKSCLKKKTGKDYSKATRLLYRKRNRIYKDFYHKASRYIVNFCLEQDIDYLVLGYNKGWKNKSTLNKKLPRDFIQTGYSTFIDMLEYKCKEAGITLKLQQESYTSGTSFLDNEAPTAENYDPSHRKTRGSFEHHNPDFKISTINADINAAYQILVKADKRLTYKPEFISQSSIEPTIINLDTFNRKTHKSTNQMKKYTFTHSFKNKKSSKTINKEEEAITSVS